MRAVEPLAGRRTLLQDDAVGIGRCAVGDAHGEPVVLRGRNRVGMREPDEAGRRVTRRPTCASAEVPSAVATASAASTASGTMRRWRAFCAAVRGGRPSRPRIVRVAPIGTKSIGIASAARRPDRKRGGASLTAWVGCGSVASETPGKTSGSGRGRASTTSASAASIVAASG